MCIADVHVCTHMPVTRSHLVTLDRTEVCPHFRTTERAEGEHVLETRGDARRRGGRARRDLVPVKVPQVPHRCWVEVAGGEKGEGCGRGIRRVRLWEQMKDPARFEKVRSKENGVREPRRVPREPLQGRVGVR